MALELQQKSLTIPVTYTFHPYVTALEGYF
jgi:hypothetical protein